MDRDKIKVLIGSKNPTKVNAVSAAFKKAFPGFLISFIKTNAPSGVSNQPVGDVETKKGCVNRLNHIYKKDLADFYVSIEGVFLLIKKVFLLLLGCLSSQIKGYQKAKLACFCYQRKLEN